MNIAVNTRLLLPGKLDGIGWFTYETLKRITTQHPEHQFIFLFDRRFSDEFIFSKNIKPVVVHPQARHPVLWYLFFEFGVPAALKKHKADLFLSPDGWLSLKSKVPSVDVIHDLNFENHPEFIPYNVRKYYHYFFPRFARKADRIATVSEYTKNDICKKYGVKPELIDVVYNGANEKYVPIDDKEKEIIREKHTNGKPYFIFISTIHPRKNLANQLKAFDMFKKQTSSEIKYLIIGEKKWWTEDIRNAFENLQHKQDIIFLGRLDTGDLHKIIGSSLALTYASYFEGFGIPIVEAFYCDIPVITSNVTSMPEVAGNAALLVDPFSVESNSDAMRRIAFEKGLRESLIEKGRERRQMFTWQKSADRLWESIEKTL